MNTADIHSIQLYLAGELSTTEQEDFSARLETDAELRDLLTTYQSIERTMIKADANELALKHTLEHMGKKYFADEGYKHSPRLWPRIMAAAAVVVLAVLLYFIMDNKSAKEDLYSSYASPAPLLVQDRGNATIDSLLKDAANEYNAKKYSLAKEKLNRVARNVQEDQFLLALAISQLETGDYQQAKEQLQSLQVKNNAFGAEASWWLVLLEVKKGDTQAALQALENIPASSKHAANAGELKARLMKDD